MKQKVEWVNEFGESELITVDIPWWIVAREKIFTLCLRLYKRLCIWYRHLNDEDVRSNWPW